MDHPYVAPQPHRGRVAQWYADEGWGVLKSLATPGGCWAHASAVSMGGHALEVGEEVQFVAETAEQDGYAHRATEVWGPVGGPDRSHRVHVEGPSPGYRSILRLDDE